MLNRQEKLYEKQSELKALLEAFEAPSGSIKDDPSTSVEDWSGSFEWDARADDVRFNIFGISKYRANQREVSHITILKKVGAFCFLCCFLSIF